ncbi:MAG: MFS transporter [Candidatus Bathyarchaeota archaeon]|nr:MFS transporter [Candidatus Bathyarchaeota archaeon]
MEKLDIRQFSSIMNYGLFVMILTHTLTHTFQNIHLVLFPVLMDEFKLGYYELGLIAAIPPLCQVVLSIPAGMLADKFGTKKMIIFSQLLSCAGSLVAGFTQNPWMLIAAVSLLYLNTTFYHPPSYSYVTKTIKPSDRSKALGLHGAGGTLGMSIGPLSITLLMGYFAFEWRQVYLFWFVALLIGLIMVLRIKADPDEQPKPKAKDDTPPGESKSVISGSMFWFIVFNAMRGMGASMTAAFFSLYLVKSQGWNLGDATLVYGASSLVGIVAAPLGGFFADKIGEKKWTTVNVAICTISYALAWLFPGTIAFTAFFIGYGFFNLLSMASNSSLTAKLSPPRQRGLGFALYFLPGSIMGAIAPMVAAFIANTWGIFPVFIASTLVFALSVPIIHFGVKVD